MLINKNSRIYEKCVKSKDDYQRNVIEVTIIGNIHSYDVADELEKTTSSKFKIL